VSKPADDERLLAVAGSISDGIPVDWKEVRQRFASDTAIVDELEVLHGLAALHLEPSAWGPLQTVDAIGRGSFAMVYRAFDTDLQREIALKVTLPQESPAFDPQRAVREARLLARVRHANVVTVFGAQRKAEAVAIAMELIKGRTLDDLVRSHGPFSARETALVGLDLCHALAAVHEAGLLHGDIKAHNVMREEGGRIVLMDFGAGRDLQAPVPSTGDFAGTPLYLAPEVFAGQPRTRTSDIYSLGILLFHLSTGTYPITGDTRSQIDRQHLQPGTRRRMRDVRSDLPASFISVVERAIAEDPSHRYQTAGELEAALTESLDPRAHPRPNPAPFKLSIAAALLAVAGLMATGLYAVFFGFGTNSERPASEPVATTPAAAAPGSTPVSPADGVYRVAAAMYRADGDRRERLRASDRLAPGDHLFLEIETSVPAYVYVVNEDEHGKATLLYPLPGRHDALPPAKPNRLPGIVAGDEKYWQVTTPGRREHFVIFVSPTRVPEVEQVVASLPPPVVGAKVSGVSIPDELIVKLRGVGGLVSAPKAVGAMRLSDQYTVPLSDGPEDARGLCVRKVMFENPGKK
jgi:eukaryotic-like serine/threonine-protein kinase